MHHVFGITNKQIEELGEEHNGFIRQLTKFDYKETRINDKEDEEFSHIFDAFSCFPSQLLKDYKNIILIKEFETAQPTLFAK